MTDLETVETPEQNQWLDREEKARRHDFLTAAWNVVRADSPLATQQAVEKLREIGETVNSLSALRRARDWENKRPKITPEENAARQASAEHKRQQSENDRLIHARAAKMAQMQANSAANSAERAAALAAREAAELERLQAEGRKSAVIAWALANGELNPAAESRHEALANRQRRSHGGIVRIESGAGK